MRVQVHVRPGSGRTVVGGSHAGALLVRVAARPVDGQATAAALRAIADAFGVRRSCVTLINGPASRSKLVEVDEATPELLARLLEQ